MSKIIGSYSTKNKELRNYGVKGFCIVYSIENNRFLSIPYNTLNFTMACKIRDGRTVKYTQTIQTPKNISLNDIFKNEVTKFVHDACEIEYGNWCE